MARRPLVGDAYVRIHADSSAIDNELRKEFSKAGKPAGKAGGKAAAKEFVAEMDKQISAEARQSLKRSNQAIVRGIVGGPKEWDRQFKASALPSVDAFAETVSKRLQRIGNAAEKAGKGKNKSFKKLQQALDELEVWARNAKAAETFARITATVKEQDKAYSSYATNIRAASKRIERSILDQDRAWQSYKKNVDFDATTDAIKRQERAFATYSRNIATSSKKAEKAILDQDRAFNTYLDNIRASKDLDKERGMRGWIRVLTTSTGRTNAFSEAFGKAFGKGSRNNFINFIGVTAGGLAHLVGLFGRTGRALTSGLFKTFKTVGSGLADIGKGFGTLLTGGGAGDLTKAASTLKEGLSTLASQGFAALAAGAKSAGPAILAIGASLTTIALVVPPVLALFGSLIGIIGALVSTIAIGLAGAALIAAPALLALAAGAAGVVLAIVDLNNELVTQKKNLKPLSDAWADLRKQFKDNVLNKFVKALASFAPILKRVITPALLGIGDVIVSVTNKFSKLFNSKQFAPFLDALSTSLPKIFGSLATAIGNLTAGLIAFFKPILPFVERAAAGFERLTKTFLDWTMSTEGQNAIGDFMATAYDRAKDLFDIVGLVGQALGALFTLGDEGGGNTLIDTIKQKLTDLVEYLNDPKNAESIRQFFRDSVDTAKSLWQAIGDITAALRLIDWEQAGQRANTALELIGKLLGFAIAAIALFNTYQTAMSSAWTSVGNVFRLIYNNTIGPVLNFILGSLAAILRAFAFLFTAMSNLPGFEGMKVVGDKLYRAADGADQLAESIRNIPDANVNVNVGLSGPGVAALQSSMARRRPDIYFASGGILSAPTYIRSNAIAGEAGREAIVPLDRPLALVDRSVRALAAFAQGKTSMASGGVLGGGSGTVIQSGAIQIVTPYANPELVAESVIDRFAANAR